MIDTGQHAFNLERHARHIHRGFRDVCLVLEKNVQRLFGLFCFDVLDAEQHEGAGPVECFADRRSFLQIELTNAADDACDLVRQILRDAFDFRQDDFFLAIHVRIIDM